MEVYRVQPGILEFLGKSGSLASLIPLDAIWTCGKPKFFCFPDNVGEIISHCGFAAGELDCRSGNRFLRPEKFQHRDDFIETGFINKPAGACIGKTEITVKVAAVGEVDICKERLGVVVVT